MTLSKSLPRTRLYHAIALLAFAAPPAFAQDACDTDAAGEDGNASAATGVNAFVCGTDNHVSGNYSVGMGYQNYAAGENAAAYGYRNNASGRDATAIGRENVASGWSSTGVGSSNNAWGIRSTAIGFGNVSHFTRTFTQAMGMSPTAYRRQASLPSAI